MAASVADLNANLIGKAQRYFADFAEPAVTHTNLPRAGVAGNTHLLVFHFDYRVAERAGNIQRAIALQAELRNDAAFAAHDNHIARRLRP